MMKYGSRLPEPQFEVAGYIILSFNYDLDAKRSSRAACAPAPVREGVADSVGPC